MKSYIIDFNNGIRVKILAKNLTDWKDDYDDWYW